jgi:hypothetical protein
MSLDNIWCEWDLAWLYRYTNGGLTLSPLSG